ncbi:MAG: hypothetical protein AAGK04_00150 [Planctomycetota bacterium]
MHMTTLNPIQSRVDRIRRGYDPQFLAQLPSGYAILANQQPDAVRGCCMLLPDPVVPSPNDLDAGARERFMADLVLLGDAVLTATGAERINYLILCNQVPWLHGHAVPRYASEDAELRLQGPFEAYDFAGAHKADATGPDAELHAAIKTELERLTAERD